MVCGLVVEEIAKRKNPRTITSVPTFVHTWSELQF
jgi:hypothetical protein